MGLISEQAQRCSNKGMLTVVANGLAALNKAAGVQHGTLQPREELSLRKAISDASAGITKLTNTLVVVANRANGANYEQGIRAVGAIVAATQTLQTITGNSGKDNNKDNTAETNTLEGDVPFGMFWEAVDGGQRYVRDHRAAGATIWNNADFCYIDMLLRDAAYIAQSIRRRPQHLDKAAIAFGYLVAELDYATGAY